MAGKLKIEATFREVIAVPLSAEMAEEVPTYLADQKALIAEMFRLIEGGWQVSFKQNFKPEGIACSLMPQLGSMPNAGYMVFGNAPTALEALAVALVKKDFLGETSDWSESKSSLKTTRYS